MRRGFFSGDLLLSVACFVALLIAVAFFLFLQQSRQGAADPLQAEMVSAQEIVILNSYLRQTVQVGNDQVPLAAVIEDFAITKSSTSDALWVKTTDSFLALLPKDRKHRIDLFLPGTGNDRNYYRGDDLAVGSLFDADITAENVRTTLMTSAGDVQVVYTWRDI